jgi:hypothetical protein
MVSAGSPTFKLYISRADDNPPTIFNPISAVSSPTGTVNTVLVSASTDSAFGVSVDATDDGDGHFSMPMSALSASGAYTVYVKLNVNGEDKLASGMTYTSFKVTSH